VNIPTTILNMFDLNEVEIDNCTGQYFGKTHKYAYSSHIFSLIIAKSMQTALYCLPIKKPEIFTVINGNKKILFISVGYLDWLDAIAANHIMGIICVHSNNISRSGQDKFLPLFQNASWIYTLLDSKGSLPKLVQYLPQNSLSLFLIVKELFCLFSIFHELSHIYHGHFNSSDSDQKKEMEADRTALELLKILRFPIPVIRNSLLLFVAALYFRFHLKKISLEDYPPYDVRAKNLNECLDVENPFDPQCEILSGIIDNIENNGILNQDNEYYSENFIESFSHDLIMNYLSINFLSAGDKDIDKLYHIYDNLFGALSTNKGTITLRKKDES